MIIIVCGGRRYSNRKRVKDVLDRIHAETPITLLVEGGSLGADRIGYYWAGSVGVRRKREDADWDRHGNAAGPIRNKAMLDKYSPQLVVAFPGDTGTADMIRQARARGVEVREFADAD